MKKLVCALIVDTTAVSANSANPDYPAYRLWLGRHWVLWSVALLALL